MSLIKFIRHKLLAIVAIAFFITPSIAYAKAGQIHLEVTSIKEYLFYFLGLISAIASIYFFKTKH